jgi:hypothetical protein
LLGLLVGGGYIVKLFLVDAQEVGCLGVLLGEIGVLDLFGTQLEAQGLQLLTQTPLCFFELVEFEVELGSDVGVGHLNLFCFLGDDAVSHCLHLGNFFLVNLDAFLEFELQAFSEALVSFDLALEEFVLLLEAQAALGLVCQLFLEGTVLAFVFFAASHCFAQLLL